MLWIAELLDGRPLPAMAVPIAQGDGKVVVLGVNPLVAAAGPLLSLIVYTDAANTQALDPVRDRDLPRILPLLDQARALAYGAGAAVFRRKSWNPALASSTVMRWKISCCRG